MYNCKRHETKDEKYLISLPKSFNYTDKTKKILYSLTVLFILSIDNCLVPIRGNWMIT